MKERNPSNTAQLGEVPRSPSVRALPPRPPPSPAARCLRGHRAPGCAPVTRCWWPPAAQRAGSRPNRVPAVTVYYPLDAGSDVGVCKNSRRLQREQKRVLQSPSWPARAPAWPRGRAGSGQLRGSRAGEGKLWGVLFCFPPSKMNSRLICMNRGYFE